MSVNPAVAVIVVAAGSGTRLGGDIPKAFRELAGAPILEHALRGVFGMRREAQVVVVAPEAFRGDAELILGHVAGAASEYASVVVGGATRQASVAAGIATLAESVRIVLVHDAARALTPSRQFDDVVDSVAAGGRGIVPGLAVADTIKRVDGDERIVETVDRDELRAMQTPQGFPRHALAQGYADAEEEYTDDAALFAATGGSVAVIPGDARAFKITTPWDLNRAEQLLRPEGGERIRVGVGVDVHAYDDHAELWLAGLHWPGEAGLAGHSDGDAVAHAITDALLGAAGLGDIGTMFGTDDPRFAQARGEVFLIATRERLIQAGFAIENVSVQIIGNTPRFTPRRTEAEATLSGLLGAPVSLSATTTDRLGFAGRGEGLTAIATAALRQRH
ncbi:2-C-methyl-D-erythritol 4-phosphate cytidylyltransferase [Mycetocola tolaasinivorans]|uniref:Bifunctional enzyme IspD/IspF n=1 Tax=Mycetocola tolaasinivorans TaxID=76635 RepID=A0A3L7AC50_9MICO|nr:2-C-methyl-D-erythritol 4-phosphate cytidylyltransferase [Mycetocola tolaasinivorans]RLP77575.1 2-C-methyl-D-erythritol 4-phosphate cytidylyltransferase [Mycetocola tolaasinivorans]